MSDDGRDQRYAEFLDRFGGHIVNFCNDYSDSYHEAKDLMQEILAALWIALPQLHADSTARQQNRWLYRVMRSVLLHHLRHWRRNVTLMPATFDNMADDTPDDSAALLEELTLALPENERSLVNDTIAGYTTTEIAERHGTTPGAISTRMYRIKRKLKALYDKLYGKQQ